MTRPLHLILFHGLGADGDDLAPISDLITERVALTDHHWAVHRPDAPVAPVSLNGGMPMPSWFDLIADNGSIDVDRDSLAGITADLQQQIQDEVGDDPYILGGFSQGGVLATRLALTLPRPPLAAILLSTWLPAPEQIAKPTDGRDPAVFIGHGEHDPLIPVRAAGKLNAFLTDCGLTNVTERHYPVEHGISAEELDDITAWLGDKTQTN
ncbi:alpha/beta fold hydrolase [Guyparkeria halopsychrophila]|uniref:alpha/beta hydrolase n=1 Tax=Guyparkeria halopsychrophila TaxID=3139421 RepID=UPI0037C6B83B